MATYAICLNDISEFCTKLINKIETKEDYRIVIYTSLQSDYEYINKIFTPLYFKADSYNRTQYACSLHFPKNNHIYLRPFDQSTLLHSRNDMSFIINPDYNDINACENYFSIKLYSISEVNTIYLI